MREPYDPLMSRPEHVERYRGHEVRVTVSEERTDWWSWAYVIDGHLTGACTATSLVRSHDAALQRGIQAARARADELEA